jgi:aryl-alcohol dehydrogenase-like predicted oxidoreductase
MDRKRSALATLKFVAWAAAHAPPWQGRVGEPADPVTAHAVLRRAVELGVTFIDT